MAEERTPSGTSGTQPKVSLTPFHQVKPICTSLLKNSKVTPANTSETIDLLSQLLNILRHLPDPKSDLTPKFIEFIYLPLSIILNRNGPPAPPLADQILEKIFHVTSILCQQWWWSMDFAVWEQLLRLSAYLIGGPKSNPAAVLVARSEETKEAAALCLEALLCKRTDKERPPWATISAEVRFTGVVSQATKNSHFTVLGSAVGSLLDAAESEMVSLRVLSLRVVGHLLTDFIPNNRLPTFLPGVVAKCCNVALARKTGKGWQASDVVQEAFRVLKIVIVGSIGDEICEREGLIRKVPATFEDIASLASSEVLEASQPHQSKDSDPHAFHRTPSWLQASASQIHIAINSLSPLLFHPTPSAQVGLVDLSFSLLNDATQTLSSLHILLLSNLLTLSTSAHPTHANMAKAHLETLLLTPTKSPPLLEVLAKLTQENLLALPSLILARSDTKVERVCNQVAAICGLSGNHALSKTEIGVGHLLGPSGGIERWGLGLLAVVELATGAKGQTVISTNAPIGLIMDNLDTPQHPFPPLHLRYVESTSTQAAIERMLRGLGSAGGVSALFSVEWFVETASASSRGTLQTSALWCASHVYAGVVGVTLPESGNSGESRSEAWGGIGRMSAVDRRRAERTARSLTRSISDLWDVEPVEREEKAEKGSSASDAVALYGDSTLPTEHVKGLDPLVTLLDTKSRRTITLSNAGNEPTTAHGREMAKLHSALALQMLSISASVLGPQFSPLLLHALYPVLRSLVSSDGFLSSTAMAALHHISAVSAYASPANLLLSNFDYALDSASRRLFKSRLDLKATKVLVILVRLVGKDVVQRAGDVVEECFDRLDEYHGYSAIVEGLMEVLNEVVKAVEAEEEVVDRKPFKAPEGPAIPARGVAGFIKWYKQREAKGVPDNGYPEFGPAPHRPWGTRSNIDDGGTTDPLNPPQGEAPKLSVTQTLISKIIRRCLPFLTHSSPLIRARILSLMRSASSVLPDHEIGPVIHSAWPFILNRLKDSQPFVITEAARLIESLAFHFGDFMSSRMQDDVWPAYRRMLEALEGTIRRQGPATPYSHTHRLYVAMINTLNSMLIARKGTGWIKDETTWDIAIKCRRFLSPSGNKELQATARVLYQNLGRRNGDLVWLVLCGTCGGDPRQDTAVHIKGLPQYLRQPKWEIEENAGIVLNSIT